MAIRVAWVEIPRSAHWLQHTAAAAAALALGARRTVLVALVDHYDQLDQTLVPQGRSAGLVEETARMATQQQRWAADQAAVEPHPVDQHVPVVTRHRGGNQEGPEAV